MPCAPLDLNSGRYVEPQCTIRNAGKQHETDLSSFEKLGYLATCAMLSDGLAAG